MAHPAENRTMKKINLIDKLHKVLSYGEFLVMASSSFLFK
jgi:hypothetical protein